MDSYKSDSAKVKECNNQALSDIDPNRTLIVEWLTKESPIKPQFVYGLESIESVFDHFRPNVEVDFVESKGVIIHEVFSFNNIRDFGVEEIIDQSIFLKDLIFQKNQNRKIIRHLKSNKLLQKAVENDDSRNTLIDAVGVLSSISDSFTKHGGFDLLDLEVNNILNNNTEKSTNKDTTYKDQIKLKNRELFKDDLLIIDELLSTNGSVKEMVFECEKRLDIIENTFKSNLTKVICKIRNLERSYRSLALFYKNTNIDKLQNITVVNADIDQLIDLDNPRFFDCIQEEINNSHDKLDLENNYSLLVIPGYLGSRTVVGKWSKMAHENKVMLITDFENIGDPEGAMEMFEESDLTSEDVYKSNITMTCNWLEGREKHDIISEEEGLFIPPSTAYAGKIYQSLTLQGINSRKEYWSLNGVKGVRYSLDMSNIADFDKMGLVPMADEYGKIIPFSSKTLYNGINLGLQTYSVVLAFDYITKIMMTSLNRMGFEGSNTKVRNEFRKNIEEFLTSVSGSDKVIDTASINRFCQDAIQKDKYYLDIQLKPHFPSNDFIIKMKGKKSVCGIEWDTGYEQIG